jgi:ribosomal-protein-alanine N-acetyltransferase
MDVIRIAADDRQRTEACARMMIASEPWLTFRRSLEAALRGLQDPGKELYAILDDGDVAGFILLDMRGPLAGYIQSVCIHPEQRNRGMGARLLAWAEQRIHTESPNIFLFVSSFNAAAQRFYARRGFEVVGRVPGFIVREHDEVLMRKTLGPWAEYRGGI